MPNLTFRATTRWIDRPLRTCRTLHHCAVCDKSITCGQRYRDGGYGKRAHESCVDVEAEKAAHAQEQAALGAIVRAVRPPTERQVLGAKIRAEQERYEAERKKPCEGGFVLPLRAEVYRHLSRVFGLPAPELSRFLSWSRSCTHAWSDGACPDCPD